MKVAIAFVVALAFLACVATADEALPAAVRGRSKTGRALGKRFGDFLKQRHAWKVAEYKSDLAAAQREVALVKALNADICRSTPRRPGPSRVARAAAAVRFWTNVVNNRKRQLAYHNKRHARYKQLHRYMKKGPKKFRAAVIACIKAGKKRCARSWCRANKNNRKTCARWKEARKYYRRAHDKRVILRRHARRRRTHGWRFRRATGALNRAKKRLARLQRKSKSNRAQKRCQYRAKRRLARWSRQVNKIKAKLTGLRRGFAKINAKIAKREKKYKSFKFATCKKVPKGRHHAFTCTKAAAGLKAAVKVHKFRTCRRLRRRRITRKIGKIGKKAALRRGFRRAPRRAAFRCYK